MDNQKNKLRRVSRKSNNYSPENSFKKQRESQDSIGSPGRPTMLINEMK
jgi:hypothetical protein